MAKWDITFAEHNVRKLQRLRKVLLEDGRDLSTRDEEISELLEILKHMVRKW
jgi:hypothetical protein